MLDKLSAEEICDGIGLCGNGSSPIKCLACKAAAEAAIHAAKSNSSIQEIESIIEKARLVTLKWRASPGHVKGLW